MNSNKTDGHNQDGETAPEYDFSHGVRGKHAKAMRGGYTMIIHKSDGATEVREVAPRPGTVILDPDVRAYFPDSEAVNRALRGLINLIPQQHPAQGESH
jgi:hypothetical protein